MTTTTMASPTESRDLLGAAASSDVLFVEPKGGPRKFESLEGDAVRLVIGDRPVAASKLEGRRLKRLGIQGVHAGKSRLRFAELVVDITVADVMALDENGEPVDLARSHASISRTLPKALAEPGARVDSDALRWLVAAPSGSLPSDLEVTSAAPDGSVLDTLPELPLEKVTCPPSLGEGLKCRQTALVRATGDVIDRSHPESRTDSLLAEVGGRLIVGIEHSMTSLRVGGPRHTALGPLERYRGHLRMRLVRLAKGGTPPVGGDEVGAMAIARQEIRTASGLWGQCGIHFGYGKDLDMQIVDPPPPHLIAVGCDLGAPASGGEIRFRAGKDIVRVTTHDKDTPTVVANRLARAVRKSGSRPQSAPMR